ncbi:hypothetical protein HID58_055445, partial [Brassica napus]
MVSGSWMDQLSIWQAGHGRPSSPYGEWVVTVSARNGWEVLVSPFPVPSFVSQELFVEEIGSSNSRTCHVIGQIVVVSHIEAVSVNGKDTQKITVELCNHEDLKLKQLYKKSWKLETKSPWMKVIGFIRLSRNRYHIEMTNSLISKIQPKTYCNYYYFANFHLYGALVGVGELQACQDEHVAYGDMTIEFYHLWNSAVAVVASIMQKNIEGISKILIQPEIQKFKHSGR